MLLELEEPEPEERPEEGDSLPESPVRERSGGVEFNEERRNYCFLYGGVEGLVLVSCRVEKTRWRGWC